uniref:Dreadlocks (inferred by orthology to a D. melanogaster protein) n=1 Tax=Strongyloides venezuelensis TaxID=75913 RepID=A0A0K0FC04_STRVS
MVIKCKIYFEAYTASGTRHAPYSTSCGHVMGKECLERFRECSNGDYFNCPFCSGNIKFSDCHPIYDIVEEMTFECLVCFESLADHRAEDFQYSSPCGHMIRKSCLERLKEYGSRYLYSKTVVGDFTLRDSVTNVGEYSISLKVITRNRHYWIRVNRNTD